jgi:hypothetical protein
VLETALVHRRVDALLVHLEGRFVDAAVHDVGVETGLDLGDRLFVGAHRGGLELDVRVLLLERLEVAGIEAVRVAEEADRAGDRRRVDGLAGRRARRGG